MARVPRDKWREKSKREISRNEAERGRPLIRWLELAWKPRYFISDRGQTGSYVYTRGKIVST